MLVILAAVVVGILAGLALRGSFRHLGDAHFRWWGLAIGGLALQLAPVPSRPGNADHWLAVGLLIGSYVVLLAFVAANVRYWGFWLVGAGFAVNLLVIVLNAGMPVSDHAMRVAYGSGYAATRHELVSAGGAKHHLERPDDVLRPLTDVIPIGTPVHNVFSVGDMVALGGVLLVMAEATMGRAGRHEPSEPAEEAGVEPVRQGPGGSPSPSPLPGPQPELAPGAHSSSDGRSSAETSATGGDRPP